MNPFSELAKSKAFWTMIFTSLISFLVSIVPALDTVQSQLLEVFLVVGSVLVGGFSVEAAAAAHGTAQAQAYIAQSQLVTSQTAHAAQLASRADTGKAQSAQPQAYEYKGTTER